MDANFEQLQEGSQAIFICDTGYRLLGSKNLTCREGQWTGVIPSCDLDECHDIVCGGLSKCIDGIGEYTCECAKGWHGGGVNQRCLEGDCQCTGNQGYYNSESLIVDGRAKIGYNYGETFGNFCFKHDEEIDYGKDKKVNETHPWIHEPWYAN